MVIVWHSKRKCEDKALTGWWQCQFRSHIKAWAVSAEGVEKEWGWQGPEGGSRHYASWMACDSHLNPIPRERMLYMSLSKKVTATDA